MQEMAYMWHIFNQFNVILCRLGSRTLKLNPPENSEYSLILNKVLRPLMVKEWGISQAQELGACV